MDRSVKNQLISDVQLGSFLSGGIDSSLVVAMMKKSGKEVKTYTVGFDFLDYDESVFAEKVASYLGCNHTTYQCSKQDVLDIIPSLPEAFNEPFADSSSLPTIFRNATVWTNENEGIIENKKTDFLAKVVIGGLFK